MNGVKDIQSLIQLIHSREEVINIGFKNIVCIDDELKIQINGPF